MIYKVKGPDGRIIQVKGPDGATPEQIKHAAFQLAQVQPATESQPGFQLGEMASNIPASAGQFVADMYQMVAHPYDTVKGLGKAGVGYLAKGANLAGAEFSPEVTGPADAVNQHFKDKYGSWDQAAQTLEKDPIGVLSDASLALTGGGLALKAGKLGKVGNAVTGAAEWVDPLGAIIKTGTAAHRSRLASAAGRAKTEQIYQQATRFKDVDLMREALKRNINPSLGPAALEAQLAELSTKYDDLLNTHTGTVNPTQLFHGAAQNAADKFGYPGITAGKERAAYNRTLRDLANELGIVRPTRHNPNPPPPSPLTAKDLHELKVDTNQRLYTGNKDPTFYARSAKKGKEQAMSFIARRANTLAERVLGPQLGGEYSALNKEYGTVKRLRDVVAELEPRLIGTAESHQGLRGMVTPGTAGSAAFYAGGPTAGFAGMLAGGLYRSNLQSGRRIKKALKRKRLGEGPKTKLTPALSTAVTAADLLRAMGEWAPEEQQ